MKSFLLFLCLAAAEKLDRTYLPPPGAKFSGGAPGDIQAPFEIPKETYSTTSRPDIYNNGLLSPEDTRIEVGINRGVPSRPGIPGDIVTPGQTTDYQNYKVPTTTTSYAFTTTTTHPPTDGYDATGPINPVTGLPSTTFDFPTSAPGFINPEVYNPANQPGTFQQNLQPGRVTAYAPTQFPGSTTLAPSSQFDQNKPGFIQGNQNQRPGFGPGSVQRPISTGGAPNQYQGNRYPTNLQDSGLQTTFVPSTYAPGTVVPTTFTPGSFAPTSFAPGTTSSSIQYQGDLNQNAPSSQGNIPSPNTQGTYYPGQNLPQNNVSLGQQLPQVINQQGSIIPGQTQYDTQGGIIPQQYPISQTDEFGRPVQGTIYQPVSTASPTFAPNLNQYPTSTLGSQPSATTIYPSGSFPTTLAPGIGGQGIQTVPIPRPVRPQAEADRNAVILNYENVITPDGEFSYSFDTSNGIHADESGTAADGVKAKGSYSYIGDDGKLYSVVYTADENGFQPRGDHLPTPPPIPEAIQKVIEQVKKEQEAGISDDGTYDEDKYGHMKYQGGRYRPQRPGKINVDEDNTDEQYTQSNKKQQIKPQTSNMGPVLSNQDYEEIEDGQDQNGVTVSYEQGRPGGNKPSRRPINRVSEKYYPDISEEGSGDELNNGIAPSQSPAARPTGDRRQFGGKFSVQRPDQYTENNNVNFRPEQGTQLDGSRPGVMRNQENYGPDSSRRPAVQRPNAITKQDSENRRQQYEAGRLPSGEPTNLVDNEREIIDNRRPGGSIPIQRPGQSSTDNELFIPDRFQGNYGNRIRPMSSTAQPFDQTEADNYQDSNIPGSINKYLPGKGYTRQPESSSTTLAPISSQSTGSPIRDSQQSIENSRGQVYRPTTGRPSSEAPESDYSITGTNGYDATASRVPITGRPVTNGPSSLNQYGPNRGRPQTSTTPVPQSDNQYYGSRITGLQENQTPNIRRPVSGRRPSDANRYTTVTPTKEEGYQYLPPQRKFEGDSRLPGSQVVYSNRKPSQDRIYVTEKEVPKPFTTPDATRQEDGSGDDYDHIQDNQYRKPQYGQVQPTAQKPYETYNKESIPDNRSTTIGSTQRPTYPQIQTRPQQQYGPTGSVYDTTQGVPTGSVQQQEGNKYSRPNDGKVTYGTTPVPSQSTRYEVTRPGQQNINRENDQTPSTQGFFTQTTKPLPDRIDMRPTQTIYEKAPSQSPYQTTYSPMVTFSGSSEEPGTIRPGSFVRPSYPQNQLPSTTYRPNYYPGQTVTEKQIVDNFGRPLPESQQPNQGEYIPGSSVTPGVINPAVQDSRRPVQGYKRVDMYGRPIGSTGIPPYAGPGSSTTEKILGEDFSGPKQAQRFDPERGYYY